MSGTAKNGIQSTRISLGHDWQELRTRICITLVLLLLFAALVAPVSAAPPVADFTSNVTKGVAPLAVGFNDTSTNNPDCWNWSFSDGTAWFNTTDAAQKNATYTYPTKGWYNVTLIANNTGGSNQTVKTQYINAAASGTTNSTDIVGIKMGPAIAPVFTPQPIINKSALLLNGSTITVNGNSATITDPSPFFSSAMFDYEIISNNAFNITGDKIRSIQLNTTPFISNLAGFNPTTVFLTLNLKQYSLGDTVSILMSDAPSASDVTAFKLVAETADPTWPVQVLGYEMDITTTKGLASNLSDSNIYFTVPLSWRTTYGSDKIRLFRIDDSPYSVSMLDATFNSTSATTATYWATFPYSSSTSHPTVSRFSPGAIGTVPPTTSPTTSPPIVNGGGSSDSGGGAGIVAPAVQPKTVTVPKVDPPKEIPEEKEPDAPQDQPAAPVVNNVNVPAPAAPVSPAASPVTSTSFAGTVASSLQEGGARAAGFVAGDKGQLPADSILPPRAKPLGAVAAGVAMAGAVALAGSAGATASGGLLGTLFGRILAFFQHLFRPVSDFFSDRLAGHAEDHAAELLERQNNPLSRSLDAARNPLLPHYSHILILGTGAALYGLAFVVAERAGMLPVVVGTYILVSGVVVVLHELAHYFVARQFVMKSELKFSTTGLLMTFFSAWFFGNVFSQPLTTKIPEDAGGDKKTLGIAMFAGPLVSLACAAVFALLIPIGGIWTMIGTTGLAINLVQVVFSLIPVRPLDGQPVFTWNRLAWAAVFVPVFAIYLLVYLL